MLSRDVKVSGRGHLSRSVTEENVPNVVKWKHDAVSKNINFRTSPYKSSKTDTVCHDNLRSPYKSLNFANIRAVSLIQDSKEHSTLPWLP